MPGLSAGGGSPFRSGDPDRKRRKDRLEVLLLRRTPEGSYVDDDHLAEDRPSASPPQRPWVVPTGSDPFRARGDRPERFRRDQRLAEGFRFQ